MHIKTAVRQGPARTSKQFFYNNLQGQDSKEELFSCRFLSNVLTGTCKKTDSFCQQACTSKQLFAKDPQENQEFFPKDLQERDSKKTVFLQVLVKCVDCNM